MWTVYLIKCNCHVIVSFEMEYVVLELLLLLSVDECCQEVNLMKAKKLFISLDI